MKPFRLHPYERVREEIRHRYLNGQHHALPSLRELSQEMGLNHATISRALADLENEGLLEVVPRKGIFALVRPSENASPHLSFSSRQPAQRLVNIELVVFYEKVEWQLEIAQSVYAALHQRASSPEVSSRLASCAAEGASLRLSRSLLPIAAMEDRVNFLRQSVVQNTRGFLVMGHGYLDSPEVLLENRFLYDISRQIPLVLLGMPHPQLKLDCVYGDPRPQMREFLDECYAAGARRFEFLGSGSTLPHQMERQDAFADFLLERGLRWKRDFLAELGTAEFTDKLRDLEELPETVIATNLNRAFAVALEAQRRGLRLPQDMRLLCFTSSEASAQPLLPYADVVLQDETGVAEAACDLLLRRIEQVAQGTDIAALAPEVIAVPGHFLSHHQKEMAHR